ncbi:MAG TPA: EAL domain-containing protein [Thermoanaerobaculales bacterium]|nr:EAL domain-containing protein [Thermoanaerobaculales bacterium]HPA82655.1 EAL domain-containing protein [Thermoanaerobaculales bacterium]HQL30387.1 EAL domain-containing protein [Thermoanaerobaculales bacterium]
MSRGRLSGLVRRLSGAGARPQPPAPSQTAPSLSFLVATSDRLLAASVVSEVEATGHQCHVVTGLRERRRAVERDRPVIALVDWRLPDEARAPLLAALRTADGAACPILALVPDDSPATIDAVLGSGCDDYLTLPAAAAAIRTKLSFFAVRLRARSDLLDANRALRSALDRFVIACGGQQDGIWDWDVRSRKVYYSPRWKAMLGYQDGDIGDSPDDWFELVHPDDRKRLRSMVDANLAGSMTPLEHRYRIRHHDGGYRWMLARAEMLRDDSGAVYRIVGRQTDVHGDEQSDTDPRIGGLHDPLTKLPNRTVLTDRLRLAFARARRDPSRPFALLFFDVDRFKNVNDSLGHLVGDRLLRAIGDRVQAACRPSDTVARFGGDEFAIIVEDITDVRGATAAAERIQDAFRVPFDLDGLEVFATVSIGIAVWKPAYERPEDLLRDSDTAMYRAKANGRNTFVVFDDDMHARVVATLRLETDLRRAIARNEFRVYYQPIVSITVGRITGFEVLVRWQHPDRGLLLPKHFIGVSEEMGAIIQIDRFVAEEACRQLRAWQNKYRHNPPLNVSVNISGTQFLQPDLVQQIDHILRKTGLYGRSLTLEVTESVLMENAQYAAAMLEELRALDIGISIDDFGTGYSSLAYLRRFKIDTLKIDYSFVSRMLADEESSQIVKTITTLAGNLGKQTVAEGVETRSQFDALRELGVDRAQGIFISPPVPAAEAEDLLARTIHEDNHLRKILSDRLKSGTQPGDGVTT